MGRAERDTDWGSRRHVETLVLLIATALALYFCARLAAPFLPALVWALALAVLFAPLQRWLESQLRYPSLAASISVAAIGLIVMVLAGFVAQRLVQQAVQGAELVEAQAQSGAWRRNLEAEPRLAALIEAIDRRFDVEGIVTTLTDWCAAHPFDRAALDLLVATGDLLLPIEQAFPGHQAFRRPGLDRA